MTTKTPTKFTESQLVTLRYKALEKFHNAVRLREEAERELAAINNLAVSLSVEPKAAPSAPE